jgi:hypothetical protein
MSGEENRVFEERTSGLYRHLGDDSVLQSPRLRKFFSYWLWLRGGRAMPLHRDVDPADIPADVLPHLFLIEVETSGRFRVRLQGSQVVSQAGVDLTGRHIDEVPGAEGTLQRFQALLIDRRPYFCRVQLSWSPHDFKMYETVVCPLARDDGREVGRIITAVTFG